MKKILYIFILIIFIILYVFFYFRKTPAPQQISAYKCPEAYTEDAAGAVEYRNTLIGWTSNFFKTNSKATTSDWALAKLKLWEDNNCIVAIERSKLSGTVSNLKQWELIDYELQNSLGKAINSTN